MAKLERASFTPVVHGDCGATLYAIGDIVAECRNCSRASMEGITCVAKIPASDAAH